MAKAAAVHHACTECGTVSGRWLGRCPGCGVFGTMVEERRRHAAAVAEHPSAAAAGRCRGRGDRPASRPGSPSSTGCSAVGSCRRRSCSSGASRASASRPCCSSALGAVSQGPPRAPRHGRGVGRTGEAPRRPARGLRGGSRSSPRPSSRRVCATLERERPDVCVIDSVQTLYAAELARHRARSRRCARRPHGSCACRRRPASPHSSSAT